MTGGALAPLQPRPPSEPSGATGGAHPGSKVHPQFTSCISHQLPGSATPLEATAITTITSPPQKKKKIKKNILTDRLSGTRELQKQSPPHHGEYVCTEEREREEGGERQRDRQRGGKKGGGSPSSEKHHSISLTPQELSKEQDDV